MTADDKSAKPPRSRGGEWEAFWAADRSPSQALSDPEKANFLDGLWQEYWAAHPWRPASRVADLACGTGALTRLAAKAVRSAAVADAQIYCVDFAAAAALSASRQAAPVARPVVADLTAIPFADHSVDLVVSQYGVEYGGRVAFGEAARILAPGGAFAAVVHDSGGGVARECAQNLNLFESVTASNILPLARAAFEAGFDADVDQRQRAEFAAADRRLAPAVRAFESAISAQNATDAMAFLRRVHRDLAAMYARRHAYARGDVAAWIEQIETEIDLYTKRMQAMLKACSGEAGVAEICKAFTESGCVAEPPERLMRGDSPVSIGWVIKARR